MKNDHKKGPFTGLHEEVRWLSTQWADGAGVFTEGVVGLADCHLRGKRGGSVCTVNIYSDTCWMNAY